MIVSDEMARQLHDRVTRGDLLSADEEAQLGRWYALQDKAEDALLSSAHDDAQLTSLRAQVQEALAQLRASAERIEEAAHQNETLRRETAVLRRQLARQLTSQPI